MIKIVEVKEKDIVRFIRFAWKIYEGDKNWVPPLISEQRELLSSKNPFFEHAEGVYFMAYKGDEPVGRVAGFVDHNHIEFHNEKAGFFGFYESVNDFEVTKALLDSVKEWLKDKGMEIMRGPMNPSTNDEVAFLLDDYKTPPVIMMTYNPPYYHELMNKYGMRKAKDLYAYYHWTDKPLPEKLVRVVDKIKDKKSISIRSITTKTINEDIKKIKEIYNSAWAKNWGFVPMTDHEFDAMVDKLKKIYVPELAFLAEIEGKPAGVSVTIPDYNQVLIHLNGRLTPWAIVKFLYYKRKIDQLRLLILGVKPEYRRAGIDALLYYHTFENAKKLGYKGGEISWILEDNYMIIRPIEMFGAKLYKKYRIYEIEI